MKRLGAYAVGGIVVVALAFFTGRYSVLSQSHASAGDVWVGQPEADMRRTLGKPLEETDYATDIETISGRLHVVLYRGFSVTLKHGRVHTIGEYPYSSFNPTPEEQKKPVD